MIPGERVIIEIERNGERLEKETVVAEVKEIDRFGNEYRIGRIGVGASKVETREVGILEAPWAAVLQTGNVLRQQMIGLGQIISGRRPLSELGGPLKIAKVSGEAMSLGILTFISLAALISINLGFINLLPIPMLDGGHLLLYGIEAIRRRPATPQIQEWAFRAGFVMLAAFMLMVTFNDLASFGLFESG
jgi:regulator of sigma E protease